MTGRRWVCPQCGGGVNGPQRPRKDDVRRYCLPCSAKTGRLVERTCPALDRQRAASSEKRAARNVRNRQLAKAGADAKWTVGPFDFRAEQKRIAKLPTLKPYIDRKGLPEFRLRKSKSKRHSSGHCYYGSHIVVTAGSNPFEAWAVLLHEMMHWALGSNEGHSSKFYRFIRSAAKEAWPEVTFDFSDIRRGWSHEGSIGAQIAASVGESGQSGRLRAPAKGGTP